MLVKPEMIPPRRPCPVELLPRTLDGDLAGVVELTWVAGT